MPGFMLVHAACALIVGVPAVAIVRRVALAKGWMAKPREDRWHREPVALLGRLTEVSAALPRPLPCPVRSQSCRRGRWLWCGGGLGASPLARGAIAG